MTVKTAIGVLLVNLGTPDSPKPSDVRRYLHEFLTDGRVIDVPWLWRQLLVRGSIVPKRYKQSAASYEKIWTSEGSPLLMYGKRVKELLQDHLGPQYRVELAMRYRQPSIRHALKALMGQSLQELVIIPLFPHYASATTGSVHQRVMEELKNYHTIPHVTFINNFAEHPLVAEAFCSRAQEVNWASYDHILFSFHGLPERKENEPYAEQCRATMRNIIEKLNLPKEKYSLCFQSRLGKEPWLQPYTSDTIRHLAQRGKKKVLVFCPSFVCDCLETLYEIGIEYAAEFKHAGGDHLHLVPGLNDHPLWIQALGQIVKKQGTGDRIQESGEKTGSVKP